MIKYGKSNKAILSKNNTFKNNDKLCKLEKVHIKQYMKSPKRDLCINCKSKINHIAFIRKGIKYYQCKKCEHING